MFMKFLFKSCADVTTAVTPQKVGNDQAIGQTVQNRHNWSKYMLWHKKSWGTVNSRSTHEYSDVPSWCHLALA